VSGELLTVDAAAALLQLHPKTVLRFIRDGRLRAGKVGKGYRILRSDLQAFAGAANALTVPRARVTSIVDVADVDATEVQRLSNVLLGASNSRDIRAEAISLDIAHDPVRRSLKIILVAAPADAAVLLKLVDVCLGGAP
jgi:excisionase family DNA binding protein